MGRKKSNQKGKTKKVKSSSVKSKKNTCKKVKKSDNLPPPIKRREFLDFDTTLTIIMKNDTDQQQRVNAFSLIDTLPEGVSISLAESKYDFILKMLPSNPHFVTGFRLNYNNIYNAINGVIMRHENTDGATASYPIFPLSCFSPYQFQEDAIDCKPFSVAIRGGTEMRFLLEPKSTMVCTIFCSKKYKNLEEYMADKKIKGYSVLSKVVPIIIENPTDEKQQVNLFDLNDLKKIDEPVVKINTSWAYGSYQEVLKSMEMGWNVMDDVNALKVYCENKAQFANPMFANELDKDNGFEVIKYFSPYQFQTKLVDCSQFNYTWTKDNPIKLTIEPKTKVVYFFYETTKEGKNT